MDSVGFFEEPTAAANAAGFSAVSSAAGFLSMTVSKMRAGDAGVLRPPSQCLIASMLNPNVLEILACVMPSPISDRFHVNFLGNMCLESFLLPSKKSLDVVQAIHHLLEIAFSCNLP